MDADTPTEDPAAIEGAALAWLQWYRAMGVEDALGETAVDWLARPEAGPGTGFLLASAPRAVGSAPSRHPSPAPPSADKVPVRPAPSRPAAPSPPARQFATAAPEAAVATARAAARDAPTLDALRAQLEVFNGCALKSTAKNLCFYRGAPQARLMLIGEAPGRDEDLSGVPFVGRAGQLLDKMLAAIGLDESGVHITNTVYWRPPGNRTPSPQETQACRPFLDRQIELVAPDFIALLGGAAANQVLGIEGGIMRLRGKWRQIEVGGRLIPVIASLHPAFLLRTPLYKRQAWRDMLAIAAALDGGKPANGS
jgi:uracil-DNA glycosylase family 4